MKKLSLEMLGLTSDEILERSQMKKITGGARFSCTCTGSVGSWEGNYSSTQQIIDAIGENCSSGEGSCHAMPQQ